MNNQPTQVPSTPPQPDAFDPQGRPLYYHPPVAQPAQNPADQAIGQAHSLVTNAPEAYRGHDFDPRIRAQYANEPDFVHTTRPYEPEVPTISEPLQRKHEESVRLYPFLNLSAGEFVMLRIRRHPIGLLMPVFVTGFVLVVLATMLFLLPDFYAATVIEPPISQSVVAGVLLSLMVLVGLVGGVAIWVYLKNQFFLTNEAVIQEVQNGLFSHREQTVSLGSIEDASYKRQGILQHIFNYGTMRLSTEGEDTTYKFAFVEDPKQQIAVINDAIEAFKNGRPVGAHLLDD